ncbi:hypothetical protein KUTeg_004040 [Tegillarca granosa]|uniref:Peptidase S1 domain-containing protein n=1 Tax=Tegillarca granosa TaxID=220873 RepID=A0ABQ9FNS0_TEGGR|nr:hypothetical protein KUTeg_004040 [Tegillarca granosa]
MYLQYIVVCGNRPAHFVPAKRIVGGITVRPGTWPFMISLHGGPGQNFFCGASLLSHTWVLTAAHCIGSLTRNDQLTLKIGATRRDTFSEYRQIRKPKQMIHHEDYNVMTVENDIALIELAEPVYFNDYTRPVCLPKEGYTTPVGTRCYAAGWGKNSEIATEYQRAMKQVNLDIRDQESCREALKTSERPTPYKLTDRMMCAGGSIGHDACSGDSGGPLICEADETSDIWYVAGVTSWGIGCATDVPGVYTKVSLYIDWIRNTTHNALP